MDIKRGIAVAPGVAIGPALVLDTEGYRISERTIEPARVPAEVARLKQALAQAAAEAEQTQQAVGKQLGGQYGAIFGAHALLLADPSLARELELLVRQERFTPEYAVSRVIRRFVKTLESLEDQTLAGRVADLFDVEKRLLRILLGQQGEQLGQLTSPVIVLAHDLSPSQTAGLDTKLVHAFATEAGGRTSHTAIVAGVLEIPAVVGLGKFLNDVSGGDLVIVDGYRGVVILNPDEETRGRYERAARELQSRASSDREALRYLPADTRDRVTVQLLGNIEFPQETEHCLECGAEGVGLYRTEFLYLNRQTEPTEQDHLDAYLRVLGTLGPNRPLVIRTLDLGADKFPRLSGVAERNPFLGLRSVRLCLRNSTLFKTQLRAILRASAFGDVRILFPMISTVLELRQCKFLLEEVKEDLEEEGLTFNPRIPVGTMIEVPSAAILAESLAREVDFFSIGTNDLVQYTLAADRNNEAVAGLYNAGDPAVLRLIEQVTRAAEPAGVSVTVCGEMSGDPPYTLVLLGLGVRQLSAAPHKLPGIKKLIRAVSVDEAEAVVREVMRLETARDVNNYLREQTRRILPEPGD
jgi:phosphotransferase system enzyme I (PtsI)